MDGPLEYLLHSQITDLFVHNTGNQERCSKHSRTNKRRRPGSRYLENCSWNTTKPAKRTFGFLSKVWINQGRGASPPNFTSHSVCEGQKDSSVCHWSYSDSQTSQILRDLNSLQGEMDKSPISNEQKQLPPKMNSLFGKWIKVLFLTNKLFAIDTCRETENPFSQMESHWAYQPHSRAGFMPSRWSMKN